MKPMVSSARHSSDNHVSPHLLPSSPSSPSSPPPPPPPPPLSLSQFADLADHGTAPELHPTVRNICCVGAGYVGGPTAAVIAYQNPHIRVTVVDRDAQRIRRWNSRHLPIYEPGLRRIVRIARDGVMVPARRPNLLFSMDVERCIGEADLVIIAVNTPTKSTGVAAGVAIDLAAFEAVVYDIAQHARAGTIIVEKSTVPCRTAQLVQNILALHRPDVHFEVLSNPEFSAAGTAMQDLLHPDRVLIGSPATRSGQHAADALASVYAAWVPRRRIIGMNVWSAELAKVAANAMLAQRISSINSISAICEATGAEIDEVTEGVASDLRIGNTFLKAGIGFGGSCLKKDVLSLVYLAESLGLGYIAEYWRHVITILGFTFKANTSDVRESPTLEIIRTLRDENPLEIAIFDPYCNPAMIRREIETIMARDQHEDAMTDCGGCHCPVVVVYSDVYEACAASNAVLVMTECHEFGNRRVTTYPFPSWERGNFNPKSFARHGPTEMNILSLHDFILQSHLLSMHREADPLRRYMKEPACAEDCPECELIETRGESVSMRYSRENVDWCKISHHMKKPKWVFDGKGIIDPEPMASLGIQLESIGRPGNL
ncbi:UDP-glucose/GDP-mannose dehydrogenase family, NAD binding domain-containing protein [Xylaria sp. FL1042]|nr:UDP-glucose/GDP-mannose dehydrogenase family, NAD binding domain-containing protein [Xylaria sp. FL1042]